jgi:hypothetical protein
MIYSQEEVDRFSDDVKALNGLGLPSGRLKVKSLDKNSSQLPINKYHANRTEYGGKWYPSQHEANDAAKFDTLIGVGKPYKAKIEQVKFILPKKESHRVDFMLLTWDDKAEFYESKGRDLESGRIRRHWVEEFYHIKIIVI